MSKEIINKVGNLLEAVRNKKPLVHSITNYVTANDCANIILAMGASPTMADYSKEVEGITKIASALVINMGIINDDMVNAMIISGKKANELNIPVVFDPVGAGVADYRNETARRILSEVKVNVIRGNISEVKFVGGLESNNKGVDASESDMNTGIDDQINIAKKIAEKFNCTVAITGVTDIISDGKRTAILNNGTKMLANVTGTGCMTTALVGGYCGSGEDYFIAAVAGVISMGIAGEISEEKMGKIGLGSFRVGIIDAISNLNSETIERMAKINEA